MIDFRHIYQQAPCFLLYIESPLFFILYSIFIQIITKKSVLCFYKKFMKLIVKYESISEVYKN